MKYILSIDPGGKPPNGHNGRSPFSIGARVELVDTWAIEGGASLMNLLEWLVNMRYYLTKRRHRSV